jgi:hypothetical protein
MAGCVTEYGRSMSGAGFPSISHLHLACLSDNGRRYAQVEAVALE